MQAITSLKHSFLARAVANKREGGVAPARAARSVLRRLALGFVVLTTACSGDDIAGSPTTTGAYSLRTVNGSSLPYTITSGTSSGTVIVDDVMNLYQGGTFAGTRHFRATATAPIETRSETGTYTFFGNSISFRVNETGLTKVAIGDGSQMTFIEQGLTMVFRK